jgi:hypothetical protein
MFMPRRKPAGVPQPLLLAPVMLVLAAIAPAAEPSRAHWERIPIDGGSELLTLFAVLPGEAASSSGTVASKEIPVLSVLRDTLGDDNPDNDRLRYVWLLADQEKGRLARWFTPEPGPGDIPRPVVDLSAPAKGVWKGALRGVVQAMMLDPGGTRIRVPSRSYFSSKAASRTVRLFEAVTLMARLEEDAQLGPLPPDEYSRVLSRLLLAERAFGGLVRDGSLGRVMDRELGARRQALGRNWELLRQRAEAEGLFFQPIAADGAPPAAAMIWISRADLGKGHKRRFRSKFLGISDPWSDQALRAWSGYAETWYFDSENRRTFNAGEAARSEQMIPLALYSLDHPKAPFLLIDFRSPWKPAAREVARRTVEEVPLTILGVATFTNWQVRGAQVAWNSVRGRRGAAIHRPARLHAAAAVRQVIPSATQLQPEMREHVGERLGIVEPSSFRRYEALLAGARSPEGLERRLERDRGRELARLLHPHRTRWLNLVTIATLGLHRYRVRPTPDGLDVLDRERRLAHATRVLEEALAASPRLEMGGDLDRIRRAARDLGTVQSLKPSARQRAVRVLARLVEQTGDEHIRREFLAMLEGSGGAGPEIAALRMAEE